MEYKAPHSYVYAASKKGDILCKIDGHTRDELWQCGELERPPSGKVDAILIEVNDLVEAAELYELYDSRNAVKSSSDEVSGSCREVGLDLVSPLLRRHDFSTALRQACRWRSRSDLAIHDAI